ncbi:MAG TPA: DUF6600 domain-containing protein [Candidatus Krumholzibacteria bacterium]|nr:DUF6600 domain-containing protein [Candidatus Krumholzibacteria bacterium]
MSKHTILIALALIISGCSGAYDRELLGDPEPVALAVPVQADESGVASYDSVNAEPIITAPADYGMFDELDSYGNWYQTDEYGPVWQPAGVSGWAPYEDGHWIYTAYGWMWVSYENYGWATYHYGYWWLDPMMGWIWIPGNQWSACPVDWFYTGDYIGWAPLPPPGYTWQDPWYDYGNDDCGWIVVETGRFREVDVGQNRVPPARFKSAYKTGTATRTAPDTQTIERATRMSVKETAIRFDDQRFGDYSKRKIILPDSERQIVGGMQQQTYPGTGSQFQTAPVGTGSTVTPPPPTGKTKGSTPAAKPTKDQPQKAKSGASRDSRGSSSGTSKGDSKNDSGKAKGGDDGKDDGKDGGTSKGSSNGNSGSTAKGKAKGK